MSTLDHVNGARAPLTQKFYIATEDLTTPRPPPPKGPPPVAHGEPAAFSEKIRRDAATLRNALAFTQVVGVLMRSAHCRLYTLRDLELLVIPPLLAGQFRIGQVKPDQNRGAAMPVAVVLWASVSADVDKKLMETEAASFHLKPEEWKSGDILWLMHTAGEARFVQHVVDELMKTALKGRQAKVRGRDEAGKSKIGAFGAAA